MRAATPSRSADDFPRQQLLQGEERLLGSILLPEREHPVHGNDRDDGERQCAHPMARLAQVGDERQGRRDPEDDGKEVRELTEKLCRDRHAGEALDGVGSELVEAPCRLGRRQASSGCPEARRKRRQRPVDGRSPCRPSARATPACWWPASHGKPHVLREIFRSSTRRAGSSAQRGRAAATGALLAHCR